MLPLIKLKSSNGEVIGPHIFGPNMHFVVDSVVTLFSFLLKLSSPFSVVAIVVGINGIKLPSSEIGQAQNKR